MLNLKDQSKFMPIVVVVLGLIIIIMTILFFTLEPAPKTPINETSTVKV